MYEATPDPDTAPVEAPKSQRRKKESATPREYALLFTLVLFAFGPLLLSTDLWNKNDPATKSGFHEISSWTEAWTPEMIRKYDPFSLSSYFLESYLPLDPAFTHRAINLALHLLAVCLLWSLLRKLRLKSTGLAVLLFAVHPAIIPVLLWPGHRHVILGFIIMITLLNLAQDKLNLRRYLLLMALYMIGLLTHKHLLFLPLIFALITYSKDYPTRLNQYNWILPILCLNLFVGVWLFSKDGLEVTRFVLSEWSFESGHYMQHLLTQSFIPDELIFYKPLPQNITYSVNTGINLAPFLLFPPFIVLGVLNRQRQWARNLLLGVISYILLVIPVISRTGSFIDGTPAFELFAYYTPLSILCVSCAFALHKLSSKLGITMGMLRIVALYTTAGIFSIFSFTFALEVRNPQNMWQSIARQWPESSQAQIAYLESIVSQENNELRKDKLILMMQALLEKEPDRLEIRKLMARTMQEANQPNNALREYRRILREGTDDIAFMEEAADFLEFRNLSFEAEKVRQRIQQLQEAAADTPLE